LFCEIVNLTQGETQYFFVKTLQALQQFSVRFPPSHPLSNKYPYLRVSAQNHLQMIQTNANEGDPLKLHINIASSLLQSRRDTWPYSFHSLLQSGEQFQAFAMI
jgi:hypothetical protein